MPGDSKDPKEAVKDADKRRKSSAAAAGVFKIDELVAEGKTIEVDIATQRTGWKVNTSPTTVDDKDILKKHLTKPPLKAIKLHFPLGLEVTARNLKGVTIKDAMDAIYKSFKKRADDELTEPYLIGFEYDTDTPEQLIVHLGKDSGVTGFASKKKKAKAAEE